MISEKGNKNYEAYNPENSYLCTFPDRQHRSLCMRHVYDDPCAYADEIQDHFLPVLFAQSGSCDLYDPVHVQETGS